MRSLAATTLCLVLGCSEPELGTRSYVVPLDENISCKVLSFDDFGTRTREERWTCSYEGIIRTVSCKKEGETIEDARRQVALCLEAPLEKLRYDLKISHANYQSRP